jgi:hypothetical protein
MRITARGTILGISACGLGVFLVLIALGPWSDAIAEAVIVELFAKKEKGTVREIGEIPYVGNELADFPAQGEVKYAACTFANSVEVLFSGVAPSEPNLMSYCEERDWSIDVARPERWRETVRSRKYKVDPCAFPVAQSSDDYEIFGVISRPPGYFMLKLSYRRRDGRFTGEALDRRR